MADTGWLSGNSIRTFGSGTAWTNSSNALTSNNSYATSTLAAGGDTTYLLIHNYTGLSAVPAGSTIDGIEVRHEAFSSAAVDPDFFIFGWVVIDGSSNNGSTGTYNNYLVPPDSSEAFLVSGNQTGGSAAYWGQLNPQNRDIVVSDLTSNFGVLGYAFNNTGSSKTISLDTIQVRIWYTPPVTYGALNPTTSATSGGTTSWATPANANAADNVYTTHTVSTTAADMPYLNCTGYGFNIPTGTVITGITAVVEKFRNGGSTGNVRDNTIQLMKAGSRVGTNNAATGTNWGTTDASTTYGSGGDLWGTTWSVSDINNSGFGVSVRTVGNGAGANRVANVDNVRVTVSYTPDYGDQLVLLHANGTNGSTTITNANSSGPTFTAGGAAALTTTAPKFGTACIDFTTAGVVQSGSAITLSGPFCITFQYKRTGFTGKPLCIGQEETAGGLVIETYVGDVNIQKTVTGTGNTNMISVSGDPFGSSGGPWMHVVLCRDASNLLCLYVNGALLGSTTDSTTFTGILTLGDKVINTGLPEGGAANCYMDEIMVSTDSQIYLAPFTAPTQEYPDPPAPSVDGVITATQAPQTAAATGSIKVNGAITATQAPQTAAATGVVSVSGSIGASQAPQTAAMTGTIAGGSVDGAITATQAPQTATATGAVLVSGVIGATQAPQTAAATGAVTVSGSIGATQAPQIASVSGAIEVTGVVGAVQAPNVASATGLIGGVEGVIGAVQAPQTAGMTGFIEGALIGDPDGDLRPKRQSPLVLEPQKQEQPKKKRKAKKPVEVVPVELSEKERAALAQAFLKEEQESVALAERQALRAALEADALRVVAELEARAIELQLQEQEEEEMMLKLLINWYEENREIF